jgi:hypothetical protein
MKKRRIIQPKLWTERPTGAVMGAGSLWPVLRVKWILLRFRTSPEGSELVQFLEPLVNGFRCTLSWPPILSHWFPGSKM